MSAIGTDIVYLVTYLALDASSLICAGTSNAARKCYVKSTVNDASGQVHVPIDHRGARKLIRNATPSDHPDTGINVTMGIDANIEGRSPRTVDECAKNIAAGVYLLRWRDDGEGDDDAYTDAVPGNGKQSIV